MTKKRITITTVYELLQKMQGNFGTMETGVTTLQTSFSRIQATLDQHTEMLKTLEPLRERVDALHGLVEKLEIRVSRIEQEYTMIVAALKRLEDRFDAWEAKKLEERITKLENRVTALETA